MTPEQLQQFNEMQNKIISLEKKIFEFEEWKKHKLEQQLDYPLDEASKLIIVGI